MEKIFNSFQELLDFNFNELQPGKSNYLKLIPADATLPKVKKEFEKEMRFAEKNDKAKPQITLEISPTWLTVIIYKDSYAKKNEFELPYKRGYYDSEYLKDLLQKIFENQWPGWEFLTWSIFYLILSKKICKIN